MTDKNTHDTLLQGLGVSSPDSGNHYTNPPRPSFLRKVLKYGVYGGGIVFIVGIFLVLFVFWYFGKDLPSYGYLRTYEPDVSSRVYTGDGKLAQQFAKERRVFIPIDDIPDIIQHAFIATEDKNFYTHAGIDGMAVLKAIVVNVRHKIIGRRSVGASTITQQVARLFFLDNERSINRKIKEAILAMRLDRELNKKRILELYLNQIYLGRSAYGIGSASMRYFNRPPSELHLAEVAYLASLPKAPNNYHPVRYRERAIGRRNWVLSRMHEEGFISAEQMQDAQEYPFRAMLGKDTVSVDARYFVEEARRTIAKQFSQKTLYTGGLSIHTTLNTEYQAHARKALESAIIAYDKRHGYRGAFVNLADYDNRLERFRAIKKQQATQDWIQALVLDIHQDHAVVVLKDNTKIHLPFQAVAWARPYTGKSRAGPAPKTMADVLKHYDVILLEKISSYMYELRQTPLINGSLVAMDAHTGHILAMTGGWDFSASAFNRATQAYRQTGSAIKPFVYYTGLESGMTPATRILDAPFVLQQPDGSKWKPQNFSKKLYGLSILRVGIEQSRNLMTVRLAQQLGMKRVSQVFKRFGIMDNPQPLLSYALGAGQSTLLRMVRAYAPFVNGGKQVTPTVISRVQDRYGKVIYRHATTTCSACNTLSDTMPTMQDIRPQIANPINAYQVVSMLEGVVKNGTAKKMQAIGIPMGGKTGTTNDTRDAWYIGVTPDLVVGAYFGYDTPTPLGMRPPGQDYDWWTQETGSSVALPAVKTFFMGIQSTLPKIPFRIPANVRMVTIDKDTGGLVTNKTKHKQLEAFIPNTEPVKGGQDSYRVNMNLDGVY